jgi:hypothetical protein
MLNDNFLELLIKDIYNRNSILLTDFDSNENTNRW